MILAAFIAGLGTIMAQVAEKMTATPAYANTASRNAAPVETPAQDSIAASACRATPAAISRPKAGSMASASDSWSIPAHRWWH
jgi:hypothetical protein